MKKIIVLFLALILSLSLSVFAEPEAPVGAAPSEVQAGTDLNADAQADGVSPEDLAENTEDTDIATEEDAGDLQEVSAEPSSEEGFKNNSVFDGAAILSDEGKDELRRFLGRIRNEYHVDACVYTAEYMNKSDPWYEAQSIYYDNDYGFGEGKDGILLYNCPNARKYAIFTYGSLETLFNDPVLDDVEGTLLYYLRDAEYPSEFLNSYTRFFERCEYYIEDPSRAEEAERRRLEAEEAERIKDRNVGLITVGVIALIIAFVMMKSKLAKTNTAVKSDYAADYMKPGSLHLTNSKDLFLYSHTSRVRIQNESRSSGSSGGGSGGGGGRGGSY